MCVEFGGRDTNEMLLASHSVNTSTEKCGGRLSPTNTTLTSVHGCLRSFSMAYFTNILLLLVLFLLDQSHTQEVIIVTLLLFLLIASSPKHYLHVKFCWKIP